MAEKQVTTMVIKVDLECEKCAKKIKKVLCKIPQIQNQIYDKKANTVTVTVVCCSPEKIKQKICCKGGECIKGIEIKVPEKPKEPKEKPKEPKEKPKESKEKPKEPAEISKQPRTCCSECNEGRTGGPCFRGCRTPAAPPCYFPLHVGPVYCSWGGRSCNCHRCGYYVCRCEYVCDDNRSSCITM